MAHPSVASAEIGRDPTARRWSPRFGYALALGGSAVVWMLVAAAVTALT